MRANYSHVHIHLRVEIENCAYSLGILIMYALVARDVDVKTNAPTKNHPYRMNPERCAQIQIEITYVLYHNTIEPSTSSWSSPIVLIPKSVGTYR